MSARELNKGVKMEASLQYTQLSHAGWPPDVMRIIMHHFGENHRKHPSFSKYQWRKRISLGWLSILGELEYSFQSLKRFEEGDDDEYKWHLRRDLGYARSRLRDPSQHVKIRTYPTMTL